MRRLVLAAVLGGLAYLAWYAYDYWRCVRAPTSASTPSFKFPDWPGGF